MQREKKRKNFSRNNVINVILGLLLLLLFFLLLLFLNRHQAKNDKRNVVTIKMTRKNLFPKGVFYDFLRNALHTYNLTDQTKK